MNGRIPHWIPDNKGASVPQRVVVVDAQPRTTVDGTVRSHTWRCGTAIYVHWSRQGRRVVETRQYSESARLWADVAYYSRPNQRTVVYFHNLPYRVRITDGLVAMASNGWLPVRMRLSSRGAWASWKRDKASVIFADIASLLSASQDTMSTVMGVKLPAITDDKDEQQWLDRSRATATMWVLFVAEYMEWLRSGECGNWQVTGAGQAWSHWRHGYYTHKVLVHSDDAALAAEREAMYTGRAEMLWWGKDLSMPAYEWDWQSAYLRIARDSELPTELVCGVPEMSIRDYRYLVNKYAILARVKVTTSVPVAPTRTADGILWPVGTYRSALWDPEITALLAAGASIVVEQAWLYRKAPALQRWADGMLKAVLIPASHAQQWKKYVAKHWGRALVGRFAARYQEWEEVCRLPWPDVTIGTWIDRDTGDVRDTAQIGDMLYLSDGYVEAAHSAPQITSYVMSLARVKLWDALCDIGMENVLYVNTDSLVTTANGRRRLLDRIAQGDLAGLVQKHAARGVEIYGHQSAIVGGTTKLAGCPTGSLRQTETTWIGECWSTLDHAVKTGELDKVTISRRRYTVRYSETRRRRLPGGRTAPWEVMIDDTGSIVRSGLKISHTTAADGPSTHGG